MKTYFAYIRVSTVRQGEFGVSLQQQKDAIEQYSKRLNLKVIKWFEEQETAAKRGRPVFGQMLQLLRREKVSGVIIHKIDRGARNLRDWSDLGELSDHGVEIHFASEALDLHSRGGRLSADIQAVVASDYIRNLREETKKGFYGRLKQGLLPMPAPMGYTNIGKGKAKELDPQTAPLVKKAFDLYGTGGFSLHSLAEELYRLGLRGRNGKQISINGLSVMLRNPFYMGLIQIRKTAETFQGIHTPLISKNTFCRVQDVLDGRKHRRKLYHEFAYRRLFRCHTCGYSLIGEQRKGHIYYRCHTRDCPTTYLKEESIDTAAMDKLKKIQFTPNEARLLRDLLSGMTQDLSKDKETFSAALRLQSAQLEERLNRLTDAFIDQLLDKDSFEARKKALLTERLDIQGKLTHLESRLGSAGERLSEILGLAEDAYSLYKVAFPDKKREILQRVTSDRTASGKSIDLTYREPYLEIASRLRVPDGSPHRDRPRTLKALAKQLLEFVRNDNRSEEFIQAA